MTKKLLKYIFESNHGDREDFNLKEERERIAKLIQLRNVLERDKFEGLNRKVQLRPLKWEFDKTTGIEKVTEALFVLKWGGELTHAGV